MIHMGEAFRDTSLSNVWQLVASLRKNFGQPRPRSTVGGQSPDFSQTINSPTIPNYQHRVPASVAHWRQNLVEFQPFFLIWEVNIFLLAIYFCCLKNHHRLHQVQEIDDSLFAGQKVFFFEVVQMASVSRLR